MRNCNHCGRKKWYKTDKRQKIGEHYVRVWRCSNPACRQEQAEEAPFIKGEIHASVFYFDIEYSLTDVYNYGLEVRSKRINPSMIRREPFVICWAGGWIKEGEEFQKIISHSVDTDEALARNDRRTLCQLRDEMDKADYIVGHNVKTFDIRKVNNRFMQLHITPPYVYKTIDTLTWSRTKFPFLSNGLDYISRRQFGAGKQDITLEDWIAIVETGDAETLLKAEMYCRHDVRMGINVYRQQVEFLEASGIKVYK